MKFGVVGSRTFKDSVLLFKTLDQNEISEIITGGAKGADELTVMYAEARHIKCTIYYPSWDTDGRAAGPIRNQWIVNDSDIIVAFWDGSSKGTASTIRLARKAKKVVIIVHSEEI